MSEIQRHENNELEAPQRQWQVAQRNTAAEQWQGISLLRDSRFYPHAAQQTVDRLFPSYGNIFGHHLPHPLNQPQGVVIRRVKDLVKSLSPRNHVQSDSPLNVTENSEAASGVATSGRALQMIPNIELMPPFAPQRRLYSAPRVDSSEPTSGFGGGQPGGDYSHFPRRKLKF